MHNDWIYWLEPQAPGRILTCPTSGCLGEPTILAQGLAMPTHLLVDDTQIYFTEPRCDSFGLCDDPGLTRNRVSRCSINGCSSPTVLLENVGIGVSPHSSCLGGSPPPVMGTTHLYVVACDASTQPDADEPQLVAFTNQGRRIFAIAKSNSP